MKIALDILFLSGLFVAFTGVWLLDYRFGLIATGSAMSVLSKILHGRKRAS